MAGVELVLVLLVLGFGTISVTCLKNNEEMKEKVQAYKPIDNDNLFQNIKTGQYKYPVIFEPIKNIRLSISSYQVTTFIDLTPYFEYFRSYEEYLEGFLNDLADQSKMSYLARYHHKVEELGKEFPESKIDKLNCETHTGCEGHSNLPLCQRLMFAFCMTQRQYYQITNSTMHIKETFQALKMKFLGMIDYLDETLRSETFVETDERVKRETLKPKIVNIRDREEQKIVQDLEMLSRLNVEIDRPRVTEEFQTKHVTFGKETLQVETLLDEDILLNTHTRKKRNILVWAGLGWGIYSNKRQIDQIQTKYSKVTGAEYLARQEDR